MYPHGKIVWYGTMKKSEGTLSFICHMTKMTNSVEPKIQIHFIPVGQGNCLFVYFFLILTPTPQ